MGQWQEWVDKHHLAMSIQRRSSSCIDQARLDLANIADPMPEEVVWSSVVQRGGFITRGEPGRATMLEFILAIGDMGLYRGFDATSSKASLAILELGDALVAKGAKPSARMLHAALSVGLWNMDGPGRLEAAFRWGAASAWDPQSALVLCAGQSSWDEKDGEACFAILKREGALKAPGLNFESCPASSHPIAMAAMSGDVKTIERLIKGGVSTRWVDPDTGATLWHIACSLSAKVGKALLPTLSKAAADLAGSVALTDVVIEHVYYEGELKIRKGHAPLHCACDGVRPDALMAVLACAAPVNPIDARGDSPLTLLSRRWGAKAQAKLEPMAKALLMAGADPGRKDKKGLTPAQSMAAKGPLGALAALLEARPEDIGSEDALAKQAFALLASRGSEGLAQAEEAAMTIALMGDAKKPRVKKSAL